MFPSCRPPLAHLLQELPPLVPRYYSIACSQSECPTTLNIALTIVQSTYPPYKPSPNAQPVVRKGLCSTWLLRVAQEAGFVGKTEPQTPSPRPTGRPPAVSAPCSKPPGPGSPIVRARHLPTIPSCQGCWRDRHGLVVCLFLFLFSFNILFEVWFRYPSLYFCEDQLDFARRKTPRLRS